nr:MAG TPA: Poxvirus virion envelope protein A14 [Caudoviricetes sp.]
MSIDSSIRLMIGSWLLAIGCCFFAFISFSF